MHDNYKKKSSEHQEFQRKPCEPKAALTVRGGSKFRAGLTSPHQTDVAGGGHRVRQIRDFQDEAGGLQGDDLRSEAYELSEGGSGGEDPRPW